MTFIKNGLNGIPPNKSIDTKKVASRYFRFANNKLDNLGEELGVGRKTKETHSNLWEDCYLNQDMKAWKKMNRYCAQDVRVTTNIYLKMRPFMHSHPNLTRITDEWDSCPKCSSFSYRVKAYRTTNVSKYRQYQCLDCHGFFTDRKAMTIREGDAKPRFK